MSRSAFMPYIKLDNIYIVPVLPDRLSGALMVRRAVQELSIGCRDAFLVALPESVKENYLQAVCKLPRSSFIYIEDNSASFDEPDNDSRIKKELVTVTPCDGLAEAVLSANELGIEPHFIDLEISFHSQIQRPHFRQENIDIDDWLCTTIGAKAFVDLLHDNTPLRHNPALSVDNMRERHMAGRLQQLHSRYKRILFVCYAENVPGILQAFKQSSSVFAVPKFNGYISSIEPDTNLLLYFLDDYPKAVQRYWESRSSFDALQEFDKMSVVFDEIIECAASSDVWSWSLRHHRAFKQMLSGVMREKRRVSIPLNECLALVNSCYDRNFEEAVRIQLFTFPEGNISEDEVKHVFQTAEVNDPVSGSRTDLPPQFINSEIDSEGETERNRKPHNLQSIGSSTGTNDRLQIIMRGLRHQSSTFHTYLKCKDGFNPGMPWPAWVAHHNKMRKRVLRFVANMALAVSSDRYRGSLERGLDLRRIIRASHKGDPSLYVRRQRKSATISSTIQGIIPVLWFFTTTDDTWYSKKYIRTWNAHEGEEWVKRYLLSMEWGEAEVFSSADSEKIRKRLEIRQLTFLVSFAEMELTPSEIEGCYGVAAGQIPSRDIAIGYTKLLNNIIDSATSHIYCVVPSNDKVPSALTSYASRSKKNIVVLTHSDIGTLDVEKLSRSVTVDIGGKSKNKKNTLMAVKQYKEMVDHFWW